MAWILGDFLVEDKCRAGENRLLPQEISGIWLLSANDFDRPTTHPVKAVLPFLKKRARSPYYVGFFLLAAFLLWYLLSADEKPWDFTEKISLREEEGKTTPVRWHAAIGLWWGALFNLCVSLFFLLAGPLVLRSAPLTRRGSVPLTRGLRIGVFASAGIALAVSAFLNAPRLHQSLWGDEAFLLEKTVVGEFRWEGDPAEPTFKSRPWTDTFFQYKTPNNHVLYSVAARLAHGPARIDPGDPKGAFFVEWKLRLPAFLAGLGALGALAWLLVSMGFPRAAMIAPWLLALHPWFVRYGSEARGYAFMLLFIPLLLITLLAALRDGRWRSWLLVGLVEFLLFASYLGSVYLLVVVNAVALLVVILDRELDGVQKRSQISRWFIASSLAGMAAVQMMLPLLPQLRLYMEQTAGTAKMGLDWVTDALSYMATGIPWRLWDVDNPHSIAWSRGGDAVHSLVVPGLVILVALALLGLVVGSRKGRGPAVRLFAFVWLLPVVLMFLHNAISGTYLYPWYFLLGLPGLVVVLSIGLGALGAKSRILGIAAPVLLLGLYALAVNPASHLLRTVSSEPRAESVASFRAVTNPFYPEQDAVLSAGFHMENRAYDPLAYRIRTVSELQVLLDEARSSGRPLFIDMAQLGLAKEFHPEIVALLEDPAVFKQHAIFYGLAEQCTRRVYRSVGP